MVNRNSSDRVPRLADHVSDSSDEEIDEDMAFNSEDERKYGAMFGAGNESSDDSSDSSKNDNNSDDDEDRDGIASDDEADDGDGGQFMLDLLNNLDKKEDIGKEKEDARKTLAHSALVRESEFSAVLRGSDLTLDQLMSGISDTKGFSDVQKTMNDMTSDGYDDERRLSTTKTPVAKVVSDRAQRKVIYEENVEDVSQWTTVAKRNREAETLDFRPKERIKISKDELVTKFDATTDFEKEMAAALEEAGATEEKELMKNEEEEMFGGDEDDDDLGRNKLSAEEFRKRRGELAKMRALMFYEEQKRHHMNKIKSKKYRKIRKKQKMRLQEAEDEDAANEDEEYARELEQKAEMERMKERMSLKHRNTSKWAKRVLRRGGNVDKDTRKALSEQVRIGDELKKKMQGHFSDSEDDSNLLDQAKALLAETEEDEEESEKKKGLFKMDFMKKGLEAQRERAKQEARELLRELEANEGMGSDSDNERNASGSESEDRLRKTKKKIASKREMEKLLSKGKLIATSLEFGNSDAVAISGVIDLDKNDDSLKRSEAQDATSKIKLSNLETEKTTSSQFETISKKSGSVARSSTKVTPEEESNPWILTSNQSDTHDTKEKGGHRMKASKKLPAVSKEGIINVADAANVLSTHADDDDDGMENGKTNAFKPATAEKPRNVSKLQSKVASLSQDELVRRAFATAAEKDIEDDFEKEKQAMRDRDDHSKKKTEENKKVSGWGSWAGEGAPAPRPPKKLPKRLQAPEKMMKKRRRHDDGKKNVIISAKRMRKTAKFQIENIPYPYSSREQYERAMAGGVGQEWNVSGAVKTMTRPEILTRAGKMIRPISKKAKAKRAPLAKFK